MEVDRRLQDNVLGLVYLSFGPVGEAWRKEVFTENSTPTSTVLIDHRGSFISVQKFTYISEYIIRCLFVTGPSVHKPD
jgi:hypothetical protein